MWKLIPVGWAHCKVCITPITSKSPGYLPGGYPSLVEGSVLSALGLHPVFHSQGCQLHLHNLSHQGGNWETKHKHSKHQDVVCGTVTLLNLTHFTNCWGNLKSEVQVIVLNFRKQLVSRKGKQSIVIFTIGIKIPFQQGWGRSLC